MAKDKGGKTRRHQMAALPWRRRDDGVIEVAIVQSRETKRWIVPKGWPMRKLSEAHAAEREAFEEAGLLGEIAKHPIGHYDYWKRLKDNFILCRVNVYPLMVAQQAEEWPEKGQREMRWLVPELAAEAVDDPGLKLLILHLAEAMANAADTAG